MVFRACRIWSNRVANANCSSADERRISSIASGHICCRRPQISSCNIEELRKRSSWSAQIWDSLKELFSKYVCFAKVNKSNLYTRQLALLQRSRKPVKRAWKKGAKNARERHAVTKIVSKITAFGNDSPGFLHPRITSESSKQHDRQCVSPTFSQCPLELPHGVYLLRRFYSGKVRPGVLLSA